MDSIWEIVKIILVIALMVVASFGFAAWGANATCAAATADIGYSSRWGFWSGCLIETSPGHWVPLVNWREFEG